MGLAEVSLTFDNSAKKLPYDFDEVVVATGVEPRVPDVPGGGLELVAAAHDIHTRPAKRPAAAPSWRTTTFSIDASGSCSGASCTATSAGGHTVTGTKAGSFDHWPRWLDFLKTPSFVLPKWVIALCAVTMAAGVGGRDG